MKLTVLIVTIFLLAFAPTVYCQSVITFDDMVGGGPLNGVAIQNGYQGLIWNNFGVVNATSLPFPSGYKNGLVSSPNVAYNMSGNPASFSSLTAFIIVSGEFTAAWENGLGLEVVGINGTTTEFDNTYTLNTGGPIVIDFPNTSVTEIAFTASGGVDAGYQGAGPVFALDNLSLVAAPEPTTWALMAGGAVLLGAVRQQRKK